MNTSYIVTLRASLDHLKKDLANAKAIASTAKLPDVIAKARIDRQHIVADMAFVRRQLQAVASENRKPITLKANIDTADARRQLEALRQSAAAITASIRRSPLTRPPVIANRASDRPNIAASMFSRTNRPADVSAAAASFNRSQGNQPPLRIPASVDPTSAKKTIAKLRDDADTPVHVPIRFRQPSGRSTEAMARKIVRDASAAAIITPRVDASKVMPAMGRIRQHARQLAAERPKIQPILDSRDVNQKIAEVKSRLDRLKNTRLNLSSFGAGGGGFFSGMGNRSTFGGGMPSAGMLAGAGGLLAGAGGAFAGAGAAAAGAGVAGAGAILGTGITGLADLERSQGNLEIVLKDPEGAKDLIDELMELDLRLPVDLGILASSAAKLAGAGFDSATIKGDITAILDAAAISVDGVGVGTDRIVRAFSQIKGAGRLLAEDVNQLQEVFGARRILSERFGMSANEVAEKSQSGEKGFDVDTILGELIAGMREDYGGALEKQSEQLYGQLDGLADRFKAFSRTVASPMLSPLSDALKDLNAAIDSESFERLTDALVGVSAAVAPFIEQVGFLAQMAIKGTEATMNAAPAAGVKVAGIATSAATTAGGIVGSAKRLFGKADAATGGMLGQAAGMAGDVLDFAPTPRNISRGAFVAIGDAGSAAMNAATDFVVDNQPTRPKPEPKAEPKAEPQPGIVDGLTTFAGGLTASVSDRIGAIADTFGDMAKDRASAFANMAGIDVASLPSAVMNAATDLRVGDAQREKDAAVKADDDTRFDKFADEMPTKMADFAKGIGDDETRQAFLASSLRLTQRNEGGRMLPTAELAELGKTASRGSVETSGFADLNKLVQQNVDSQRQQETQQKQLAVQEEMRTFLETIADQTKANNQPRTATIAPG